MIKPHQQLEVWKRSFDFVKQSYALTDSFPKEEKYGLTSQIRRAAVSVPANIAEGAARKSKKEFIQFLHISLGSTSELDTLLLLSRELNFVEPERFKEMDENLQIIFRMLRGLIKRNMELVR